ncbi:hypothetical protein BHF71_01115 [Vulcanibacillus modesticaldus]|uniref:Uncharacterized protein n=1 Tax=Vulcanibacillus modesticaldus TaxID=337097 RepID=A0A1D2YW06_9BACI|nr:flagellar hook-basal body protein [Vulcanibacillus modesticaldus]OEF99805.1 hypothetical protein BHF71_01115 [Vulcanibacillus modesticaldus]
MIRGLYTAASGMITQQQRQTILTNNLANINTPGYKSYQGTIRAFPEVLLQAINQSSGGKTKRIGSIHQGVFVEESVPIFSQGDIIDTGLSNHIAIWDTDLQVDEETGKKPQIFFTIKDENDNILYTRSGLFTEDASGQLVTPKGYMLLDDMDNPIQVKGREFTIDEKGKILFSDGEEVRIQLTKVKDPYKLVKQDNGVFKIDDEEIIDLDFEDNYEEENYRLLQGKLERSNVDPTQTLVEMMTALRIYESNQKVIQAIDRTLEKAVNEVGRV